jgi:aspartokinase/homoserine dehydrogenase 1
MLVMKFGGTSLGDAHCFAGVAAIVTNHLDRQPVVVVSAMSGVTNTLLGLARSAQNGDSRAIKPQVSELVARHTAVCEQAIADPHGAQAIAQTLAAYGQELESILTGVRLVREATPRSLDAVAAYGEKMSSALLAALLRERGIAAQAVTAEDLIVTDDNHGQAAPLLPVSNRRISRRIPALQKKGIVPVITGFIARSASGATTTLSRGGSDFTASLIGAALSADEIWIWTDVDGVMTADPRLVPHAHTLPTLSYAEAAELSYFGAKVLHPKTVAPAVDKGIPIWIKNTFNPDHPGTAIGAPSVPNGPSRGEDVVKAITSMSGMSMLTVQGAGMIGVPGVAARVFSAVAHLGASVMMISQSSSEYNICFVVSKDWSNKVMSALRREFALELKQRDITEIYTQDVAVLAAVGEGMRGAPGVAGRLFSALGRQRINVIAIAQGSSELNISFVVEESQRVAAVQAVHGEFIAS